MTLVLDSPALLLPEITDDATRRQFLAGSAAFATLLLAACGDADTGIGGEMATRPFEHAGRTTQVPVAPQRIVTLESTAVTWQLHTLGLTPIATGAAPLDDPTSYIRLLDPAAADELDESGIVSVADGEVDLEAVAAPRPDLIITADHREDVYDQLSEIAPTVLIRSDLTDDRYFAFERQLAELTGTMSVLERLHDEYDARVAALRDRFADRWPGLEWLVLDEYDPEPGAYLVSPDSSGGPNRVFTDLGAPLAASAQQYVTGEPNTEVSAELLTTLQADAVFVTPAFDVLAADPSASITPEVRQLLANTAAGRSGQLFVVGVGWANASIASLSLILDDLERFIAERPDGFFVI